MKKTYCAPVVKKIDYAYDEQIIAQSVPNVPIRGYADWFNTGIVCTYELETYNCNKIYNEPKAKGLDTCSMQGFIPLG